MFGGEVATYGADNAHNRSGRRVWVPEYARARVCVCVCVCVRVWGMFHACTAPSIRLMRARIRPGTGTRSAAASSTCASSSRRRARAGTRRVCSRRCRRRHVCALAVCARVRALIPPPPPPAANFNYLILQHMSSGATISVIDNRKPEKPLSMRQSDLGVKLQVRALMSVCIFVFGDRHIRMPAPSPLLDSDAS